jgi:hypothetical protein
MQRRYFTKWKKWENGVKIQNRCHDAAEAHPTQTHLGSGFLLISFELISELIEDSPEALGFTDIYWKTSGENRWFKSLGSLLLAHRCGQLKL